MKYLFNLAFSSILILSFYGVVINPEFAQFRLVENGLSNWFFSSFILQIYTTLILFLILVSWVQIVSNKTFKILSFIVLTFIGLDLVFGFFHEIKFSRHSLLFVKNYFVQIILLVTGIFSAAQVSKYYSQVKLKFIFKPLIITTLYGVSFALTPVYIDDYSHSLLPFNKNFSWSKSYHKVKSDNPDNVFENSIVVLATTNCPHCNRLGIMIGITQRIRSNNTKVIFAFPGNSEDADAYLNRNYLDVDYVLVDHPTFLKLTKGKFPVVYQVKNGSSVSFWDGESFNYSVMDEVL